MGLSPRQRQPRLPSTTQFSVCTTGTSSTSAVCENFDWAGPALSADPLSQCLYGPVPLALRVALNSPLYCWIFPEADAWQGRIYIQLFQLGVHEVAVEISPVCPLASTSQIHSPINLVVKPGSPLPSPSWRQGPSIPGHSIYYYKHKSAPTLAGQYEKLKRPWLGASAALQQLKYQCVILILKPKHSTVPATRKKINSVPAKTRTLQV